MFNCFNKTDLRIIFIRIFIISWITYQISIPLNYYLFQEDILDERFCWRMYVFFGFHLFRLSSTHEANKILKIYQTKESYPFNKFKQLNLEHYLSTYWLRIVKIRPYNSTIEKLGSYLCFADMSIERLIIEREINQWSNKNSIDKFKFDCKCF